MSSHAIPNHGRRGQRGVGVTTASHESVLHLSIQRREGQQGTQSSLDQQLQGHSLPAPLQSLLDLATCSFMYHLSP